jgi:hypothetical protein
MTVEWHRSEPREVRPFFAAQQAETSLEQSGIRLVNEGDITKETHFELDDADLRKLELVLYPAVVNPHVWMPEGLSGGDLDLIVVGRQPLLKRTEIIGRFRLDQPLPEEIKVAPELLKSLGGGRNTQITLAIVLADDRPPNPGSPFVRGHWLARKTFALRTRSTPVLFDIRTRTEDEWVANGYPANTLYTVDYTAGIESPPEEGVTSVAIVYFHADAQNRLAHSKLGDAVQPLIAAEIVTNILQQSVGDWEKLQEPPKGSALDTLLKQLRKVSPVTVTELAAMIRTKPSKVRAIIQSRLDVMRLLK